MQVHASLVSMFQSYCSSKDVGLDEQQNATRRVGSIQLCGSSCNHVIQSVHSNLSVCQWRQLLLESYFFCCCCWCWRWSCEQVCSRLIADSSIWTSPDRTCCIFLLRMSTWTILSQLNAAPTNWGVTKAAENCRYCLFVQKYYNETMTSQPILLRTHRRKLLWGC